MRHNWPLVAIALFVVLGFVAFVKFGIQVGHSSQEASDAKAAAAQAKLISVAVHDSQVAACQASLEPPYGLRYQFAQSIREQVDHSHDVSPRDFPSISHKRFKRLIREGNARRRDQIRGTLGIDCEAAFPQPATKP